MEPNEEKVFDVAFERLSLEPRIVRGERDEYRLVVARLADWPAWGGNHVASKTTPNSFLRWRGEVACEWIALRQPTDEEVAAFLAGR
jgi:hypothetical protein